MYLRSIALSGFKTFATRTEIRFDGGVTAIVGPNGAGKSNIVDAFKWVLGESQAKDLRGRRMEDVIYSGGARRPRASQAEVTLTVDNGDGRLPLDFREVEIRRRVDRGGQSEYFLQGARVRRRDVLDLLASTGLTVDSYALINQSDIEGIVLCSAEERRVLLEEAAQVRGIKAKRSEAAARLEELARNLLRLEDLRGEILPRLEVVRGQAEVAREAAISKSRLEVLRGSLVWEQWREARDRHRRAESQVQSLSRRLEEARTAAQAAEAAFRDGRQELEAAQDKRLERQRRLGGLRLELSHAEHELEMATERMHGQARLAAAARAEEQELSGRAEAAAALLAQLKAELAAAEADLSRVPPDPPGPPEVDPGRPKEARRAADAARRASAASASALAAARTRRQFLEESSARLAGLVEDAVARTPAAEQRARAAADAALEAAAAATELVSVRAELQGLAALRPAPEGSSRRLGDVIIARPGWEAALSAALGPLVDARVALDEEEAVGLCDLAAPQQTILFPGPAGSPRPGSLLEKVSCEAGFEDLAAALLGRIAVGDREESPAVTQVGLYREAGLIRAGSDPRVGIAARRRTLLERAQALAPIAGAAKGLAEEASAAERELAGLRQAAAQGHRLEEERRQLKAARLAEEAELKRLPELEGAAQEAEAAAGRLAAETADQQRLAAEHRAELRRLDLERGRWRDRVRDLARQRSAVEADLESLARGRASRAERARQAAEASAAEEAGLAALRGAVDSVRERLSEVEVQAPGEEAEMAESARKLIALEEARVDARLRAGTLGASLELISNEAQLAAARMEELRSRMPEGKAPEDVPGGKAREREMRSLERRLEELGPTNELAERELTELEERHRTLAAQLEDIVAARQDLDQLIDRLRSEEESRYEAVFGAVAANFREYFSQLSGGGQATLRHASGTEGPRSGVEILAQPPRKRLVSSIQLLSSGERSLVALALVLALEAVNPSPFLILDEVDAALDDANVGRYVEMLERLGRERQFLVITHNYQTMAAASSLYGVHLDESGSSHLVSVRLEDVRERADASPGRPAAASA